MRSFASVAMLLLLAAACGGPTMPTATPASAVSFFENDVLSFEYPANWHALVPESGDPALVLLSTEQLAPTERWLLSCRLKHGGVLIATDRRL